MKLKKFDYQINDHKKIDISAIVVSCVIVALIGFVVYKTFAIFSYEESYPIINATIADFTADTSESCFEITDEGVITKYNYGKPGCTDKVVVPQSVNGKYVKEIATNAFRGTKSEVNSSLYGKSYKTTDFGEEDYYVYTDQLSKQVLYETVYENFGSMFNDMTEERMNQLSNEIIDDIHQVELDENGFDSVSGKTYKIRGISGVTSTGETVFYLDPLFKNYYTNVAAIPNDGTLFFYENPDNISVDAKIYVDNLGRYVVDTELSEEELIERNYDTLSEADVLIDNRLDNTKILIGSQPEGSPLISVLDDGIFKMTIRMIDLNDDSNIQEIVSQLDEAEITGFKSYKLIKIISMEEAKSLDLSGYTHEYHDKYVVKKYLLNDDNYESTKNNIFVYTFEKNSTIGLLTDDETLKNKLAGKNTEETGDLRNENFTEISPSSNIVCSTVTDCSINGESGYTRNSYILDVFANTYDKESIHNLFLRPSITAKELDLSRATKLEKIDDYAFNVFHGIYSPVSDEKLESLFCAGYDEEDDPIFDYTIGGLEKLILPNVEAELELGYECFSGMSLDNLIIYNNIHGKLPTDEYFTYLDNKGDEDVPTMAEILYFLSYSPFIYSKINTISIVSTSPTALNQLVGHHDKNVLTKFIASSMREDFVANQPLLYGISSIDTIEVDEPISEIGYFEFSTLLHVDKIVLPNTITSIDDKAFEKYNGTIITNRTKEDWEANVTFGTDVFNDSRVCFKSSITDENCWE